jgi:hypothetical protein
MAMLEISTNDEIDFFMDAPRKPIAVIRTMVGITSDSLDAAKHRSGKEPGAAARGYGAANQHSTMNQVRKRRARLHEQQVVHNTRETGPP